MMVHQHDQAGLGSGSVTANTSGGGAPAASGPPVPAVLLAPAGGPSHAHRPAHENFGGPQPGWVRLDRLKPGRCAVVVAVEAPDDDAGRLMVMGVCKGRKIEGVKTGDPLILRVLGSRLGVSARLAQRIWVDPCPSVCPNP